MKQICVIFASRELFSDLKVQRGAAEAAHKVAQEHVEALRAAQLDATDTLNDVRPGFDYLRLNVYISLNLPCSRSCEEIEAVHCIKSIAFCILYCEYH